MKYTAKQLGILTLFISISLLANTQKAVVNKDVDAYIRKEMQAVEGQGLAVAVIKDGKILHAQVYGTANKEWDIKVTHNTVFHIASVTKLFTSTLVMKWLQEGKLQLEDPISKYIKDSPEKWKEIRIKHLLSHESGIVWPTGTGDVIGQLKDSTLRFAPGTDERYMNGDYFVLQAILEHIGGRPFPQLLTEEVLLPLNMTESGYDIERFVTPVQVMKPLLHKSQLFTKGKNGPLLFKAYYPSTALAAAGLFLSLNDAIKWTQALDKGSFITPAMQDTMLQRMPLKKNSSNTFTMLGWTFEQDSQHVVVGHSGGPGLGDIVRIPEEKLTVIVLNNYADMYPYMTKNIARFFIKELSPAAIPKTFDRGLDK